MSQRRTLALHSAFPEARRANHRASQLHLHLAQRYEKPELPPSAGATNLAELCPRGWNDARVVNRRWPSLPTVAERGQRPRTRFTARRSRLVGLPAPASRMGKSSSLGGGGGERSS